MKHIFIVNPAAGKRTLTSELCKKITSVCKKHNADFEIYTTKAVGDAEKYVCENFTEGAHYYSCGGDGTLNEVANAVYRSGDASVGMIPIGTGNDFPKNFSDFDSFFDIEKQLEASEERIDLIKYNDRFGINMFNIGFDAECVKTVQKLRNSAFVGNSIAYIMGVAENLILKPCANFKITFDDKSSYDGKFLLCAIANGSFCGGGFKALADACINDGEIDVLLVKNISRTKFLTLVSKYKNGTILSCKAAQKYLIHKKCKAFQILCNSLSSISIDGELEDHSFIDFTCVPSALKFLIPKGVRLINRCDEKNELIFPAL